MDYLKQYNLLILRAQHRPEPACYCEWHHIVPKSCGGSNKKSNLVLLTAREHWVAHRLLAKLYKGEQRRKMTFALQIMGLQYGKNSRQFAIGRKAASDAQAGYAKPYMQGENNVAKRPEVRAKISQSKIGANNPQHGKQGTMLGKKMPAEAIERARLAKLGKKQKPEHAEKSRMAALGKLRPKSPCPICGKLYTQAWLAKHLLKHG